MKNSFVFLSFWNYICEWTELQIDDPKKDVRSSIWILSFDVLTTFLWFSVLEIIATQNDKKDAYASSKKVKKKKKLATDYMNAVLRTALKKILEGLHKCYASHRIKNDVIEKC